MAIDFKDSGKNKRFNDFLIFGTAAYLLHKHFAGKNENHGFTDEIPKYTPKPESPPHIPSKLELIGYNTFMLALLAGYIYLWVEKFIFCSSGFLNSLLFYFFTLFVAALLVILFYFTMFGYPDEKNFRETRLRLTADTGFMLAYILLFAFPAWYRNKPPTQWNIYYSALTIIGWIEALIYVICMPLKVILYFKDKKNANRKTGSSGKSF